MTGIVDDITKSDAEQQRQLVLAAICKPARGSMTIKQLVEEVGSTQWGEIVMSLTIDDIRSVPDPKKRAPATNGEKPEKAKAKAKDKAPKEKKDKKPKGEGKKRSKIDWDGMQKDILALMKSQKEPVKTGLICETLKCTPVQARKALDFLLEDEKIEYDGEGRGRHYWLAGKG